MKIIGGHDYYDSALSFGADTSLVFKREKDRREKFEFLDTIYLRHLELVCTNPDTDYIKSELEKAEKSINYNKRANQSYVKVSRFFKYHRINVHGVLVYFCGKTYTGFCVDTGFSWLKPDYIWDIKELFQRINDLGCTLHKEDEKEIKNFYAFNGGNNNEKQLIDKKITIAVIENNSFYNYKNLPWKIDGFNLKDIKFYRVKDAFQAFQEISMWIGGVIPRESPKMVQIVDEKIRIEKRGFDARTSFRKEPTKKRRKTKI